MVTIPPRQRARRKIEKALVKIVGRKRSSAHSNRIGAITPTISSQLQRVRNQQVRETAAWPYADDSMGASQWAAADVARANAMTPYTMARLPLRSARINAIR